MRMWSYLGCAAVLIFLSGCASLTKDIDALPEVKRIQEPQYPYYETPKPAAGSLWSELTETALFPDNRARRIGDIVVVYVEEDPEANLDANTSTGRTSSVGATLQYLGFLKALAAKNPNLAQTPGTDKLFEASLESSHEGEGSSDRTGHVKAYIAAMVVKVLPNGNLYINGKRQIMVNDEIQYIVISGVIRPQDIDNENQISSMKVADARISYAGVGAIGDKQKAGWLGRVTDHVWPF